MAHAVDRSDTSELFITYLALFGLYFLLVKFESFWSWKRIILAGILFRMVSLFATPNLSDDYYRFLWDGRVIVNGGDVYSSTPEQLKEHADFQTEDLYEGVNSKGYFTVYPPVNQFFFALAAFFGGDTLPRGILLLHLFMLLGEVGALFLLSRYLSQLNYGTKGLMLYAFNPLVIVEVCGNLHFEGWMITLLLAALVLYKQKQVFWSAVCFGLAVMTKLLPLILLPALIPVLRKQSIFYFSVLTLALFVCLLPFFSTDLFLSMASSLDLYFRTFEFNSSVYYVVREIGELFLGYHPPIALVGPVLSVISFLLILLISWLTKWSFHKKAFWVFMCYFLLTTTVHPWYILMPLLFSVLSKSPVGVVWSCVVVLSYSHYSNGGFQENYWLIVLEYLLVFAFAMFPSKLQNFLFKTA
ncbi:MAG: glycosyltransferase 87 family protein [Flavobacteriales bacterium]